MFLVVASPSIVLLISSTLDARSFYHRCLEPLATSTAKLLSMFISVTREEVYRGALARYQPKRYIKACDDTLVDPPLSSSDMPFIQEGS